MVITFSKEIDPSTINFALTKGGEVIPGNDYYLRAEEEFDNLEFVELNGVSYNIGTFTVIGDVIGGYGADGSISKITLDSTGKILTLHFFNLLHDPYADAADSTYIEFTPDSQIKDIDGEQIDTSVKVREANGNKHY
ncbi:hypothetical protein ACQCVH_22205 [Bacillus infantis]|uniref:hypothetical protein n=1 Tax=Bacillus infantis TaxID=324767 RepID=UPI003CE69A4A